MEKLVKKKSILKWKEILIKHKVWLIFLFILIIHSFFRFYQLGSRNTFGWDQVDNAWAAKDIIVDHRLPLLGMQAKLNAGFYIGPLYYYLIAIFYFLTNLDPIASGLFVGATSIFTITILFLITRKIFSEEVALAAAFINAVSFTIISGDRVQWPVNLIAPVSLIIFFALYQVLTGREKYLILLAAAVGFSFHLHFTGVFYSLIILLTLPFWPRTKRFLRYALVSLPIFVVFLIPNLIAEISSKGSSSKNIADYLAIYFHGLYLVRVGQLAKDAFIEFESVLFKALKPLKYLLYPLFLVIYFKEKPSRERLILGYLVSLWFLFPWFAFSLYSGEISNYYFSLTRPIVLIIIAYLLVKLFEIKNIVPKVIVIAFLVYYSLVNIQSFFRVEGRGLDYQKQVVLEKIGRGEVIEFKHGDWQSYLYYFYTR